MNFLVTLHLIIALVLIVLVLVQDSKGGGALGIGAGSNSLLGATGAQTLYARMTRWVAALFGISCLVLSLQISRASNSSVIDAAPVVATPPVTAPTTPPATTEPAVPPATPPENSTQPATK
jgi:preprotein translocase subunit SecG